MDTTPHEVDIVIGAAGTGNAGAHAAIISAAAGFATVASGLRLGEGTRHQAGADPVTVPRAMSGGGGKRVMAILPGNDAGNAAMAATIGGGSSRIEHGRRIGQGDAATTISVFGDAFGDNATVVLVAGPGAAVGTAHLPPGVMQAAFRGTELFAAAGGNATFSVGAMVPFLLARGMFGDGMMGIGHAASIGESGALAEIPKTAAAAISMPDGVSLALADGSTVTIKTVGAARSGHVASWLE